MNNSLEDYFAAFRNNIAGYEQSFTSPFGRKKIVYADWTASGRMYLPIEEYLQKEIMPFVANTHTRSTVTGTLMSDAYAEARQIIKKHVNAGENDVLVFCGSGMTAAVNKLQRILGMKVPERFGAYLSKESSLQVDDALRPVVFVSHMEHHSNQISWLETIADVEVIDACKNGNVDLEHLQQLLEKYRHRKNKIAAVTACSNVTGIQTPYHAIAKLMHANAGLCFVDFACAAPYVAMNMHPGQADEKIDAIYFSPHKFLGGPGTPGVLIFDKKIYKSKVPDQPGGGTVVYSNPWGAREYISSIEEREDGGTPPFLQAIKAAMCITLKEKIGVGKMIAREKEMLVFVFERFSRIAGITVLEQRTTERLGIVSFIVNGVNHNLVVKILNDRFGIQARGGCSCAGTYGHILLGVDKNRSHGILQSIRAGDLQYKPGWVRLSIHPVMSNAELAFMMDSIESTVQNLEEWSKEYTYDPSTNEYSFKDAKPTEKELVKNWFAVSNWK